MQFYAHSGVSEDRSDWQLLEDHLQAVARLAEERGRPLGLAASTALAGRLHDLGKYDPQFDRVLRGENLRVDHSTAGGKALIGGAAPGLRVFAELLAYAILGHHAGLPDKTGASDAVLKRRIAQNGPGIEAACKRYSPTDLDPVKAEILALFRRDRDKAGFDLSLAGRMIFSCLVDADFRDTQAFYDALENRERDRNWPELQDILPDLRERFDGYMARFPQNRPLDQKRSEILEHLRARASMPPGLFTLSVPTGGGKTLASLGFALDHAARHGHRRIIYAIPYTSIIDQTVAVFRKVLGEGVVLEHHSAIETPTGGEAGRDKAWLAMEDWAAPVIVTTNVQLFESLFAARPSRCRKLHNIAGSVIVLDEAQCLPRKILLPTLAMIDALAAHYGCSIVLCSATQPAFDSAELGVGGLPLAGRELAPGLEQAEETFRRAHIARGGEMDDAALIAALQGEPQGFVIVNSRKHALALYHAASRAGLNGLVHLTTRQYPAHRRRILADIRKRLEAGEPCRLIATSLIEAGVDLDFPRGWRAEAGLDSVIQAAGRVNREGRRPLQDSTLTVFTAPDHKPFGEVARLAAAMQATARQFDDLLAPEAIQYWFKEVYWRAGDAALGAPMAASMIFTEHETNFPYRTMAENYRMIDSPMLPVIIPRDDEARRALARLGQEAIGSGTLARDLQPFIVQIPARARELLRINGQGSFHAQAQRGDQFFALDELSLYHDDFGLWWENADYLSEDQAII